MDTVKTCSKCGQVKPVDAFYDRCAQCKSCTKAQAKAWKKANPEKIKARDRVYYKNNAEKIKARKRVYYKNNPEKIKNNPEKRRAKYKAWRKANLEKDKANKKAWREANPEKMRACRNVWDSKQISNLGNCYVRKLITRGTSIKEVPQYLIDLKRVQVQITRKLKELKRNENT